MKLKTRLPRGTPVISRAMGEGRQAWAQPVADVLSTAMVLILCLCTMKRMQGREPSSHPAKA